MSDNAMSFKSKLQLVVLAALLVLIGYLMSREVTYYGFQAYYAVKDRFDSRPVRHVLFIGNSRTYYHNMPMMVRFMADSAQSPYLYVLSMHTPSGESFKGHWENSKVQNLLELKWDEVVLQGQSPENLMPIWSESFLEYGEKLILKARETGVIPKLYPPWIYEGGEYKALTAQYAGWYNQHVRYYEERKEFFYPFSPEVHYAYIQRDYLQLAQKTGADLVNIPEVWEKLRSSGPQYQYLTVDGNHPSLQGSYLVALMFYAAFSGDDVNNVSYVPGGLSQEEAEHIKKVVRDYLHEKKQNIEDNE